MYFEFYIQVIEVKYSLFAYQEKYMHMGVYFKLVSFVSIWKLNTASWLFYWKKSKRQI
jgi:hypothetical protein